MATDAAVSAICDTPDALIGCILDVGEVLLSSGAEIVRVEDTLSRLCAAYGFRDINVFSITSSIILTAQCPDGRILTQTRRIPSRNTNLETIANVNSLSRQICRDPVSIAAFQEKIREVRQTKTYSQPVLCLNYAVISAVFSVFFGGSAWDAVAAAISGLFVFAIQYFLQKLKMNGVLYSLLTSALTALVVVVLVRLGIGDTPEKINIGNIMLLIPGVSFTTSLRDLTNGDTISGLVGLSEAVIKSIAIAIGFAAVLVGIGGIL